MQKIKTRKRDKKRSFIPCSKCNGTMSKYAAMCAQCWSIEKAIRNKANRDKNTVLKDSKKAYLNSMKIAEKPSSICEQSPNNRHYWIIDIYNNGVCKYCECKKKFLFQ